MSDATKHYPIERTECTGTIKFDTVEELHDAVRTYFGQKPDEGEEHIEKMGNLDKLYKDGYMSGSVAIKARPLEDGSYTLKISGGGMEFVSEKGLAEHLGTPVGHNCSRLERDYETSDDGRFEIPAREVVGIFKAAGVEVSEQEAFEVLAFRIQEEPDDGVEVLPKIIMFEDEDVYATIKIEHAASSIDIKDYPDRDYDSRLEEGYICGAANSDLGDGYYPVTLRVDVRPHEEPAFDPDVVAKVKEIAQDIEQAWGGVNNAPAYQPSGADIG